MNRDAAALCLASSAAPVLEASRRGPCPVAGRYGANRRFAESRWPESVVGCVRMILPGLRSLPLHAMTSQRLHEIIREGETLFVECKSGIAAGDGHAIAKAVASLANTLGGWVLVGVDDGGAVVEWQQPGSSLIDAVRQRLEGKIDPMPSFAAAVVDTAEGPVGVVRVYESADTPHLVNGTVYVREPAKDKRTSAQPPYLATAVRSHFELAQLVQRGELARAAAESRLGTSIAGTSVIDAALGRAIRGSSGGVRADDNHPQVIARFTPLTITDPWRGWPATPTAVAAMRRLVEGLAPPSVGQPTQVEPLADGCVARSTGKDKPRVTPGGHRLISERVDAAVDASGLIGATRRFTFIQSGGNAYDWRELQTGQPVAAVILPLVVGIARTLESAELLGRYAVSLSLLGMSGIFRIRPEYPEDREPIPGAFEAWGEVTVDGHVASEAGGDIENLVDRWARSFARASGVESWDV